MDEEFKTLDEAFELATKGVRGKGVSPKTINKFVSAKKILEDYGKPLSELNDEREFKKFWKWLTKKTKTGTAQGHAQSIRRLIEVSKPHKFFKNILMEDNMRLLTKLDEASGKGAIGAGSLAKASNMEGYIKSINEAVVGLNKEAIRSPATAWRSNSLKNFIIMQSSSGPRMTELIKLISKHGYDPEMQTLFAVSTKGVSPANIDYDLGEFHSQVIADQTAIAENKNYKFTETRQPKQFGQIKKFHDIWPYNENTMATQTKKHLTPIFKKNNVKWVEFNPETSKKVVHNFQTKHLRNQFVKMAVLTTKNDMAADRLIGHKGSSTKVRNYPGTLDISAAEARALQIEGETLMTTRGQDLDTFWGRNFARTQGHNPLELSKQMGVDLRNTDFVNSYKSPTPKEITHSKKVFKDVNTNVNFNNQIDNKVDGKLDTNLFKKGAITTSPLITDPEDITPTKPKVKGLSQVDLIKLDIDMLDEEFSAEGIERRERLAARGVTAEHNLQKATPEEINKAVIDTGADIKTPSGKAKVMRALGSIGKKLIWPAGVYLGWEASKATLGMPTEAWAADPTEPKDYTDQAMSGLFGIDTPEEKQKARAKYERIEAFLPMVAPPSYVLFPTEKEKEEQEEAASEQMSALFPGA
mgnify:CR=1 FL=1